MLELMATSSSHAAADKLEECLKLIELPGPKEIESKAVFCFLAWFMMSQH